MSVYQKNETPHCSQESAVIFTSPHFLLVTDEPMWSFRWLEVFPPYKARIRGDIFTSPSQPISSAAKIAAFLWIHPITIPKAGGGDWRVLVLWFTLDVKIIGTCIPAHALTPVRKKRKKHSTRGFISPPSLILFYSLQMWRRTHGRPSQMGRED